MKVAYVHIPKTGGGSIKHWWTTEVSPRHEIVTWYHEDLEGIKHMTGIMPDTSFTVVRNTWRRLISAYMFGRHKTEKKLRKRGQDADAQETLDRHQQGIIPFIEWMRERDHYNVRCQAKYSAGVTHVIRDHSSEEWQPLLNLLGVPSRPGHTHRVLDYDPKKYMNSQFVDWVTVHYRDEIKTFGFQPEV